MMMSSFTEDQIAQLSAKLDRMHVKERNQSGRTLSYIEGWHAISEANRIFGFDGWTRETVMSECCFSGTYEKVIWENGRKTNRTITSFRCSYRARVRVTILGVVREGTGHGHGFADNPGEAHESAEKEAETDAMKRALMTFGNPFGLALYDKKQENVGTADDGVAMADTREMEQGFVKDPITVMTDRRLGPPKRRRSVPRETGDPPWPLGEGPSEVPPQETGVGEDQRMVPAPRLVEFATQAANKGMWALQEFCKALEAVERASIKRIVVDQLQPIARRIDEERNMQPRIDAEWASRELADQGEART